MAYDEGLHFRIENILSRKIDHDSKKMFGGICYLLNGNMLGGLINDELIIRAGKEKQDELLELPHTREFDITGRPMKGWIMIEARATDTDKKLESWLDLGIQYAASLPSKLKKKEKILT